MMIATAALTQPPPWRCTSDACVEVERRRAQSTSTYELPRLRISEELQRYFPNGSGVEVGVRRAKFSSALLERWPGGSLTLVDPWGVNNPAYDENELHDHESNYRAALAVAARFGSRMRVLRMTSLEAAPRFADASLDFVYIDGDHSYAAVRVDLEQWWPKLRTGGLLMGDDYTLESERRMCFGDCKKTVDFGVTRAVAEFCARHRILPNLRYQGEWRYADGPLSRNFVLQKVGPADDRGA